MSPNELIEKHSIEGRDRYAVHRNAESEAWRGWYRSGATAETREAGYAYLAIAVAEQFHNPPVAGAA